MISFNLIINKCHFVERNQGMVCVCMNVLIKETFEDHEVPLNFFNGALHGYTNSIPLVNSTWYCIGSKSEAGQSGHLSPGMSPSFERRPPIKPVPV